MRRIAALVLYASLLLLFANRVFADEFDNVSAAANRGDFDNAYRLAKPLAEQGNAKAQFFLGFVYDMGKGVPRDNTEAIKWYRKAAEQGIAEAQCIVGMKYLVGSGTQQDEVEAAKWVRRAAEQGGWMCQFHLGRMYMTGSSGVPKDPVQALMWFMLAAMRLPPEVANLPIEEGSEKSSTWGKEISFFGGALAAVMTPEQIAEAERLAREWKPKKEK